jgi:hypothetical protein
VNTSALRAQQAGENLAEPVATVAHWQQIKRIPGPRRAPAAGNGAGGLMGRQTPFEFVRDNENAHEW